MTPYLPPLPSYSLSLYLPLSSDAVAEGGYFLPARKECGVVWGRKERKVIFV